MGQSASGATVRISLHPLWAVSEPATWQELDPIIGGELLVGIGPSVPLRKPLEAVTQSAAASQPRPQPPKGAHSLLDASAAARLERRFFGATRFPFSVKEEDRSKGRLTVGTAASYYF